MKEQITCRQLSRADINKLQQIDRTETIDAFYHMRAGVLVLEDGYYQVPDWGAEEKQRRIRGLQNIFDHGATFFGAFDGDKLVGVSVLDHSPVKSGDRRLNLEGLWVSYAYRRAGVGRKLFQLAAEEARQRGARAMYVSATNSKNTVDFYRKLGCRPAQPIDDDLYQQEPEDIHLEMVLLF